MKKLLFLSFVIILAACGNKNSNEPKEPEKFKIDLNAKVYIKSGATIKNPAPYARMASNPNHLTPLEVVKQAKMMFCYNDSTAKGSVVSTGWAEKDTISEIPAFIQYGAGILAVDGFDNPIIVKDWIYAYDLVIIDNDLDTIGYIPNDNFINAELQIRQALADKDTASVYDLFQNAFKFYPITGSEWLQLKKQNLN